MRNPYYHFANYDSSEIYNHAGKISAINLYFAAHEEKMSVGYGVESCQPHLQGASLRASATYQEIEVIIEQMKTGKMNKAVKSQVKCNQA